MLYDPVALTIVVVSTFAVIMVITWRAMLPMLINRSPTSILRRITPPEAPLDWAVHLSVGFMILAIFSL